MDGSDERILRAIEGRVRPYESRDVAMATGLSLAVVRVRLYRLRDRGLVEDVYKGDRGPFWRIATDRRGSSAPARIAEKE